MWLLLYMSAALATGTFTGKVLDKFEHKRDCQREEVRIFTDMEKKYPDDHTFTLVCFYREEAKDKRQPHLPKEDVL